MSNAIYIYIFLLSLLDLSLGGDNHSEKHQTSSDFLLCRHCGYGIASASLLINLHSPAAESIDNHTLFGLENVGVQTLKNPLGVTFSAVTSKGGTCLGYSTYWQTKDSWYPGYAWKACKCYRCQNHLGWIFEPMSSATSERVYASVKGFYLLNLHSIISEDYADSLIVSPQLL